MLREATHTVPVLAIAAHQARPYTDDTDSDFDDDAIREVDAVTDVEPSEIDNESLYDADAPTDGYFQQRPHPRQLFLADPSVARQAEELAKAQEAQRERRYSLTDDFNANSASSHPAPSSSHMVPSWPAHDGPILDAGPAPPDYAAATADRSHESDVSYNRNASPPRSAVSQPYVNYGSIHPEASPRVGEHQRHGDIQPNSLSSVPPLGLSHGPFGRDGVFGRNGLFQDLTQPQSMRDRPPSPSAAASQPDEESGLLIVREERPSRKHYLSRKHRKPRSYWPRFCCNLWTILGACIAAVVLLIVLLIVTKVGSAHGRDHISIPDPATSPVDDGENPERNSTTGDPHFPFSETPIISLHRPSQQCPLAHISETTTYIFDSLESFSFIEAIAESGVYFQSQTGRVYIRPAQSQFDGDVRVNISVASASPWMPIDIVTREGLDGLVLEATTLQRSDDDEDYSYFLHPSSKRDQQPCIDVVVTIEVPSGLRLRNWKIASAFLDILSSDFLFDPEGDERNRNEPALWPAGWSYFYVTGESSIYSVTGHIHLGNWSSRDTYIDTSSGDITGPYALYDSLNIHTQTGAVRISVRPKDADFERIRPAKFLLSSGTGDVKVEFPHADDRKIPVRIYETIVSCSTSSVSGTYILGSHTKLKTSSGSLQATLLPIRANSSSNDLTWDDDNLEEYFDQDEPPRLDLDVATHTGSIALDILPIYTPPTSHRSRPPTWHHSCHRISSNTGSMRLSYPEQWTGGIIGQTLTGDLSIRGRDVHITESIRLPGTMHRIAARKRWVGDDEDREEKNARLQFYSQTSSARIVMGDDV